MKGYVRGVEEAEVIGGVLLGREWMKANEEEVRVGKHGSGSFERLY